MISKILSVLSFASAVALVPGMASAATIDYAFSPQSTLSYHVTHPLHHVTGVSHSITGVLRFSFEHGKQPQLLLPATLQAPIASFGSENANRDSNMQTMLDAASFPEAIVKLKNVHWDAGDGKTLSGVAEGILSLHGISHPVAINVTGNASGQQLHVQGHFSFLLSDFAIERPSLLFMPIDNNVTMDLDATALAQH